MNGKKRKNKKMALDSGKDSDFGINHLIWIDFLSQKFNFYNFTFFQKEIKKE